MIKKNDLILIAVILFISIIGFFAIRVMNKDFDGKTAVIMVDGSEVSRISIDNSAELKTVSFKFGENTGYLDIKDGAVKMREMDIKICPEKVCSETGWISKSYETIVCLPNRIVVSIENGEANKGNDNLVDSVAR